MDCGYDPEVEAKVAGVMFYGLSDGETELVIADGTGKAEIRRTVMVEKPIADNGRQQLIDYLLLYGETNSLGDKVLVRYLEEFAGQAVIEYTCMDETLNFYYYESEESEKIEWSLFPTGNTIGNYKTTLVSAEDNADTMKKIEYYLTMRMEGEFITAVVDLATYQGETLEFEKGWFRIPVEEELQKRANAISKRAFETVREFLLEETGLQLSDIG